jgi:hypothetical protein
VLGDPAAGALAGGDAAEEGGGVELLAVLRHLSTWRSIDESGKEAVLNCAQSSATWQGESDADKEEHGGMSTQRAARRPRRTVRDKESGWRNS